MDKPLIVALHGFLGLPSDWTKWHREFAFEKPLYAPNLWTDPSLNCQLTLDQWLSNFIEKIKKLRSQYSSIELWGYSMGGRLALSILVEAPNLIDRAMLLSTSPGIENETSREARAHQDRMWAEKFKTMPWGDLMLAWNDQKVFQANQPVDKLVYRLEENYPRERLALALTQWSQAHQINYWPKIERLRTPIQWHVGALDETYVQFGSRVKQINPEIDLIVHHERGHRLLS